MTRFFKVIVHGRGIRVDSSEGALLTGFYTARKVNATEPEKASRIALDMVAADWKDGHYANLNRGHQPALEIDSIIPLGFLSALLQLEVIRSTVIHHLPDCYFR